MRAVAAWAEITERVGLWLRLSALAVASAVRLVQINGPLSTIMLQDQAEEKNQISLTHRPPKSPGVQRAHGLCDQLQAGAVGDHP